MTHYGNPKFILTKPVSIAVLFLSLLAYSPPTSGSVYFVDSMHGSDKNTGTTADKALRSISKVNALAFLPGDTICFARGGQWVGQLNIRHSGAKDKPITYTAYGKGPDPVIRNPGDPSGATVSITADWIIVEHFQLREAHDYGVAIRRGADHNIVRQVEATLVGMGIGVSGRHNLVTRNYTHDLTIIRSTPGGDDDYGAVGIWLFDSNNEVSYNRMVNCKAPSLDYGFDGGMVEFYGDVDSSYVHHNWGENCVGAFEVGGKGDTLTGNLVAYNISVNNLVSGGFHIGGKFGVRLENFRVENNVFIETSAREYTIGLWRGDSVMSDIRYRNNIFYIPNHHFISKQSGFIHENNLYYLGGGTDSGFTPGPGEIFADPLFVNVGARDFHLRPGSPAIDAGVRLGTTRDYDDNPVPAGRSTDIGAFEFESHAIERKDK